MNHVSLAWLQLANEKQRLAAAVAGISFAVMLMLIQLAFYDAVLASSTRLHDHLKVDLVMLSPQYEMVYSTQHFTERRLYEALAVEGVQSVSPMYLSWSSFRNP